MLCVPMIFSFICAALLVSVGHTFKVKLADSHVWYHQRPKIHNPSETIPSGFCCVYKPSGWSTHETSKKVKYLLQNELRFIYEFKKPRIKVSYFERMLDRKAEGVLLLAVGAAFTLMPDYVEGENEFRIEGWFGGMKEEEDDEGRPISTMEYDSVSRTDIEKILPKFRGRIMHQPPFQYNGMQMNQQQVDYLNGGVWPEVEPYPIQVSKLVLNKNAKTVSLPFYDLKLVCDHYTYPRTLMEDMAKSMKSNVVIENLVRTKQSGFHLWDCIDLESCSYEELKENIVQTSTKAGIDCASLVPAEKYAVKLMKEGNMKQRNRLKKEEREWLARKGGEAARAGSGLDQAPPEKSYFDRVRFFGNTGEDEQRQQQEEEEGDVSHREWSSVVKDDRSPIAEQKNDAVVVATGEDPSTIEIAEDL